MQPEIKLITPADAAYQQMLVLRDEVLRRPLGMSVYQDDLSNEGEELLLVAILDHEVVGCTIIKMKDPQTGKLRQMAVAGKMQGRGLGAKLVLAAEEMSLQKGYKQLELNARQTAVPFYERLGYTIDGDEFTEVGIPHRLMKKQLA